MKNLKAKKYLSRIKDKTEKIQEQEECIQRLRDTLGIAGIRYDKDRVQTSPDPNKTANIVAKIIEEEQILDDMKQSLINYRIKVIDEIKQIDNENFRKVLNVVYVDMKTLKECSQIIGFSYDYVRELHPQALKAFEEKFLQSTT